MPRKRAPNPAGPAHAGSRSPERRNTRNLTVEPEPGVLKAGYDKSWAVVIGINNYGSGIRRLDYAAGDAAGMAELLIKRLGFPKEQVFVVLEGDQPGAAPAYDLYSRDATKETIERLLYTELPDKTGPDDLVIIFFAGHGESRPLPGGAKRGYLLPANAVPGAWHTYVDLQAVMEANELCRAKHIFYLLDACYSGLATTRSDPQPRRYEADMLTNKARQVLTAGTARQAVADQGPEGHSLFTWHVIQGLRGAADLNADGVISASELMVYVKNQVAPDPRSQQTPDFGMLPGHESGGDFLFVLPAQPLIDLSPWVKILDVGQTSTAAAAAVATAMETCLAKAGQRVSLDAKALFDRAAQHDEITTGSLPADTRGTYLGTVVYVAEQFGVLSKGSLLNRAETYHAYFYRLGSRSDIPDALARGRPVVARVTVYHNWFRAPQGVIPPPEGDPIGDSVITITGYNPADGSLRFANVWGTAWGDQGFGRLSAEAAAAELGEDTMWAVQVPERRPSRPAPRGMGLPV